MSHKNLLVGISVSLVLIVLATTPVWGEADCRPVVLGHVELNYILAGPENCDGYDLCASSVVRGTFNGTFTEFMSDADEVQVDGPTFSYKAEATFETSHGNLYFIERSIVNWAAPDGYAVIAWVTGGTGRYEGATGWLVSFANQANTFVRWGGEVCWGEEE